MDTTILGQHRPFMLIKSFVQHSGWQEMVSLCSLIRLIGVCADRDQPEFLCSRSDSRYLEVYVATAGGWLTRYRPREVRNSIYRYRKIHIDYRSKFLYRFISPISIIYGNTTIHNRAWPQALSDCPGKVKIQIFKFRDVTLLSELSDGTGTNFILICIICIENRLFSQI